MITTDLGSVTAYADAVEQGYTGTREEFGQVIANFADSATQVAKDRTAVEAAKKSVEEMQSDVTQKQETVTLNMNTAVEAAEKAKQSASDAEASKQATAQSEQNINNTVTAFDNHVEEKIAGFDSRVFEAVEQSKEEINTTKQQAINTITNQQDASVNIVKTEGEKIITKVGNDAKTVADDRATVEEATQTVLNNAQEVAQNTQTVASNTEKAAASAEGAKTSADNAAQSAKSVEDASKQIEQNKKDVASLKEDLTSKADKTALVKTDRKLDALWKLNQGISYEFQTDEAEAYQKTVPSGAKMVSIKSIGGKTIVWNQLISDGAGELISAPVNEVVEQGRNLFDCYGFSCTSIANIAAKRDIVNDYGTTISTIDPTNRLIVTQNKTDGSAQGDYRNGYFTIGIRGLKYNTNYILAFDFTPTKMLIVDPMMKLLVNGKSDYGNSASDFTLNVKKHVTIKFVYNANNDAQFLELRNSGMSGIIENFQIEEGTTVATYSPYHKTSYPIPQAILNLPGYGWSAGDVRNEVNWENKQYIQRVDKVDLGTLNWEKSGDIQHDDNLTYKSGSLNTVIRRYSTYSGNSICEKFNIVKTNDINRNEYEYSIGNSGTAYPLQFTVKSTFLYR